MNETGRRMSGPKERKGIKPNYPKNPLIRFWPVARIAAGAGQRGIPERNSALEKCQRIQVNPSESN